MGLVFAFAMILAGTLLLTVAVTGNTFSQAIRGQADTSRLHATPGA